MAKSNFNLHWDDLLGIHLENATEINVNTFKEEFNIDPAIFDESFDECANGDTIVTLLSDSQISEYAKSNSNERNEGEIYKAVPLENYATNQTSFQTEEMVELASIEKVDDINGFVDVDLETVKNFNIKEKNKNTSRITNGNMKRLNEYLHFKNENRKIHDIPMAELDEILSMFILAIRKEDGEDYQPTSLRQYISTFDRVLQENYYPYTIGKSSRQGFPLLRETMTSKFKRLKKDGKGNKENAAQAVSDEEIETFYEKGLLRRSSPQSLINTLWLNFTVQFGMRGVQEHYMLCWGDIKVCNDSDGTQYLELQERQTKTRTGETLDTRRVPPRIWETNDERDPVATYHLYAARRPQDFSSPLDPFYLAPRTTALKSEGDQWFMRQRIGQKKLASLMKSMSSAAGIDRRLTNHSARKHLVQKLRDSGAKPTDIMQISGHKNVQSILNYSDMSISHQKNCSKILSASNVQKKSSSPPNINTTSTNEQVGNHAQPPQVPAPNVGPYPTQPSMPGPISSLFYGATVHIHAFNMYGGAPNQNN